MKRKIKVKLVPKLSALVAATLLSGSLPALADPATDAQMQQRIEQLENQVKQLQKLVTKVTDKSNTAHVVDGDKDEEREQEFNRIKVKVEALEDSKISSGFKDLKISGMIDPTYIYNQGRNSAGFNFLGNFNGSGKDAYAYDNSYFGQSRLQIDKELEGGTKFKLALVANKSTNANSILHEASMSMPIGGDANTRLIAGQLPDWSGYEYYFSDQTKLITHNLLFDFTIPNYYTGAGIELIRGSLDAKAMIANMNTSAHDNSEKGQVLAYRGDYSINEFTGIGFAGLEGEYSKHWLDTIEVDGYYTKGPLTLNGHVGYGRWKKGANNGGDAEWAGISGLIAYKFQPTIEGVVRLDYLNNDKNGGGTFAVGLGATDFRNGFGPTQAELDANGGDITLTQTGANRTAMSLGINYAYTTNVMFKAEYRFDYADIPVFFFEKDNDYKHYNQLIGLSTVMTF